MYLKLKLDDGRIFAIPVAGGLRDQTQRATVGLLLARRMVARKLDHFTA